MTAALRGSASAEHSWKHLILPTLLRARSPLLSSHQDTHTGSPSPHSGFITGPTRFSHREQCIPCAPRLRRDVLLHRIPDPLLSLPRHHPHPTLILTILSFHYYLQFSPLLSFHFFISSLFPSPILRQLHPKPAWVSNALCCVFFFPKTHGKISPGPSPGGSAASLPCLPHPSGSSQSAINRWEQQHPLKATCITQSPLAQGS